MYGSEIADESKEPRINDVAQDQQPIRPAPFHILRFMTFMFMESSFTALAWYCYSSPRLLPWFDFEPTTVRSGFITIFTLWHTVAIACAFNICADSFSREWAARDQMTDVVSVATSGIIDRAYYFTQTRATKTFKVAFLAFLGLLVFRTIGSSAITVASGVQFDKSLPIGLISTSSLTPNSTDITNAAFTERLIQADMVVRLERLFGAPWGYVPQPNLLIPLPIEELNLTTRVTYETDVVSFHYDCQWRAPDSYSANKVTFGNGTWTGDVNTNATSISAGPTGVGKS